MWSQLHSHVTQEKVAAAKELLTDAKLRPVWIFEALGPKPWGDSVEVVECWLTLVDLLPKQYPLAKSGGLRPLSDALNNPDCRDLLAQCLERLIDRDAVLIDQAIMVQKVVGDHVDALAINAAQFLTTAFVRSRITRKSFQSILEHVPRLWHLDGSHLQGLFDLLFADPEGFKKVDGLKKQKLADKANNVSQSSYHGGFFDFVKLHRDNAHLHRLLPQMLQTFFAHWQERRKTLHSVQIDGTQGVKRQREELKAKFDTGFFFMELLVDALVESSAGDDAVSCVNSLWRMCASCNAFRKDEKSDLLKTYVKFLVEREKKENDWTGLEICLSLDATCLEEHFPALIKHSCPPSFSRAAVNAHAQRHDIGGLLTLLEGDCPWEGLGEALRDALTLCLPEQTCDLLQSLAKCPDLLATVLEGNFAVTEQTAPEVYAVIQNFPLTSRRAFLAKQAALRRLAKWTGNGMEDLRFRTPSSGSVTIEERLTVQLHRAALGKKKITDISVFSEADWELVRPHLPLLSTIEDLRPILRQRLLPEDLAVAFETEVFTDFDIKQWAHRACKEFSFSREMPPEYLPDVATINRRKWSAIEKIVIFGRLPPGPDVQRAMGNGPEKEAKLTREDALKHPIDKMSKALLATSGAWKYEELVVAWTLIEKSILSFHDYELLHKILLQTRCYRRLWTRATKICLNAALWSSEPAQTLLTLLKLAPPRGGQPPWVKRIPSVLACVRRVTEMVYTASCGEEAQKRSRLAVRVWQAVASGNVRWAPSVGCKKLQMALKNYIWFLVACFLDCDRSFVGPEMASKSGSLEDVAAWREAQKILQQGLLPLLEMMDDRQKQALYAQLQEPMKSMFREANAGFKKHGFYTGKY